MLFYVGKNFTATLTKQELKPVTCEKCRTQYHYLLSRTATGHASAPYYIGQDSAQRRAENQAKNRLYKRLRREAELVPCPHCKWINHALIVQYRKSKYKPILYAAILLLIVGVLINFIMYISNINNQPAPLPPEFKIIALITVLAVAILLTLQFLLRLRINPNTNGSPQVPVGTPPALLKSIDPITNAETITPVPSDLSNLQSDAQWATFRPGQLHFDLLCCQCLDIPTTHFKFPIPVDKNYLPVPLCQPCLRKLQTKWWLCNLAAIPLCLLLGYLLAQLMPSIDAEGRIFLAFILAGVLTLFAVVINDRRLHPYRLRIADRARQIHQIRFQNPAYTALLIRKLGQQDGLY